MADEPTKYDAPPSVLVQEVKADPEPPVQAPAEEAVGPKSSPKCPTCKGTLDVYQGTNALKVNTGFCDTCGKRVALKG